jgi:hypothetical protein
MTPRSGVVIAELLRGAVGRRDKRYADVVFPRSCMVLAFVALASGCAGQPPPSPAAARQATPESITYDNPGGDAQSPIDAALERLLASKPGRREDRFETLDVPFMDHKNWRRVRFFGYPTRVGFRYGKDPTYAAGVVMYSETDDDRPIKCLEGFVAKAQRTAETFDLEVGELRRSMSDHRRGVEAVDWPAWEAKWKLQEEERIAKTKEALAAREKRVRELRAKMAERRKLMAEKWAAAKRAADAQAATQPPATDATSSAPAPAPPENATDAAGSSATPPDAKMPVRVIVPRIRRVRPIAPQAGVRPKARPPPAPLEPRPAPLPPGLGMGSMPVIATTGQFVTLFERDRYLGAAVAYESWPGTCLVQGFAVKIGTDEALAQAVLDHWLEVYAPRLRWKPEIRKRPKIQNR